MTKILYTNPETGNYEMETIVSAAYFEAADQQGVVLETFSKTDTLLVLNLNEEESDQLIEELFVSDRVNITKYHIGYMAHEE